MQVVTSKRDIRVLEYIREFGSITTLEAIRELGNTRLSASVYELRNKGYDVQDTWQEFRNRYGEKCRVKKYFLGSEK